MQIEITCPAWCDGEHLNDSAADAVHQRVLEPVPVVALNRRLTAEGVLVRIVEAIELKVVAFQHVGSADVWIAIVEGESLRQRTEISLESAHRLHRELAVLLGILE